jgi:hypothetical protein
MEREMRGIYRRRRGKDLWARSSELKREEISAGSVSSRDFRMKVEDDGDVASWGPPVSEREGKKGTDLGWLVGPRA